MVFNEIFYIHMYACMLVLCGKQTHMCAHTHLYTWRLCNVLLFVGPHRRTPTSHSDSHSHPWGSEFFCCLLLSRRVGPLRSTAISWVLHVCAWEQRQLSPTKIKYEGTEAKIPYSVMVLSSQTLYEDLKGYNTYTYQVSYHLMQWQHGYNCLK